MREILFKGFHPCEDGTENVFIDGKWIKGKWVIGGNILNATDGSVSISPTGTEVVVYKISGNGEVLARMTSYKVIPGTVGQFTGLTDKNDIKVFDGDILKGSWGSISKVIIVYFDADYLSFRVKGKVTKGESISREMDKYEISHLEVIGNIHDNPELLVVEK